MTTPGMRLLVIGATLLLSASTADAQYRRTAGIVAAHAASSSTVTLPSSSRLLRFLSVECEADRARGREAAGHNHSGTGWMVGGVASGVVLGLIGTAIITAVAASSDVRPYATPEGVEGACYREGYSAKAKSMNTTSALAGGLIGTVAFVLIYVSATSSTTY